MADSASDRILGLRTVTAAAWAFFLLLLGVLLPAENAAVQLLHATTATAVIAVLLTGNVAYTETVGRSGKAVVLAGTGLLIAGALAIDAKATRSLRPVVVVSPVTTLRVNIGGNLQEVNF